MADIREVKRAAGVAYEVHWRQGTTKKQHTFTVKRQAERHALKAESEIAQGNSTEPLVKNSRAFKEVAEASLAASKGKLKPRTYDGYLQMYARHVLPELGSRRIGSITSADIENVDSKVGRDTDRALKDAPPPEHNQARIRRHKQGVPLRDQTPAQ